MDCGSMFRRYNKNTCINGYKRQEIVESHDHLKTEVTRRIEKGVIVY